MARREDLLDSALTVLGRDGLRQLTHRQVDRQAGLAEGSTSNLYRTRQSLLQALVDRLVELDLARWNALDQLVPGGHDELLVVIAEWIGIAVGPDRVQTAARYALFLAAANEPELRDALQASRDRLLTWGAGLLPEVPPARVADLFDQLDGLILHQLCLPRADFDPLPAVAAMLSAVDPR